MTTYWIHPRTGILIASQANKPEGEWRELTREQYHQKVRQYNTGHYCTCLNSHKNPIDAIICGWCGKALS